MNPRETLLALAARCEREEPSRELNEAIAVIVGWRYDTTFRGGPAWVDPDATPSWVGAPRYTTSLDAALTLVPEGWACEASRMRHGSHASVRNEDSQEEYRNSIGQYRAPNGKVIGLDEYVKRLKEAKTPALALCAAALHARAAMVPA